MLTHRQLFLNHVAQTSDAPLALEIERAEGIYLYSNEGKKYIDLISGIAVSNVGHCHPEVVKAVKLQVDKYMHLMVYGEYIQSPQVQLAELLVSCLPDTLSAVYFVNSGSEAIEGAMKLAKRYTGRTQIATFKNAYHGSTQGALSIMGNEEWKQAFRPLLPDVVCLNFNDESTLAQITSKTACVVVEAIQGEAGVTLPENDFLIRLRERCTTKGTLLILDEVQTGFGRTGKLFAFEHYGIIPDILCLAKGMGGGMPIGAFVSSSAIMNTLSLNPVLGHITTFGGHPVSCAAALASLQIILNERLHETVPEKEKLFRKLLQHSAIKNIRGKGLLMAVDFYTEEANKKIIGNCISNGVIADWFLFDAKAMRIAPPLTITIAEIELACKLILKSIAEPVKTNAR